MKGRRDIAPCWSVWTNRPPARPARRCGTRTSIALPSARRCSAIPIPCGADRTCDLQAKPPGATFSVVSPIHGESMPNIQRLTGTVAKLLAAVLLATLVAGCTAAPPKPAMVPLGQTGDFGYSERDVGTDRIEVTYTGSNIRVSFSQGREYSRLVADRAKTRDLAIWRAAQFADQRGMAAMRTDDEARDTAV